MRTERCVCGGSVVSVDSDPTLAVRSHNAMSEHREWRARGGMEREVHGPATEPVVDWEPVVHVSWEPRAPIEALTDALASQPPVTAPADWHYVGGRSDECLVPQPVGR